MWEANRNFYNVRKLQGKGHVIPSFRFDALEEEYVKKTTVMCEIFKQFGNLSDPFNIRQMLTVLKISEWKTIHPFAFYLDPL